MVEKYRELNEVIVGSADPCVSKLLSRLKREGQVRRLAPRIYTTNLTDAPEVIVGRNIWTLVGKLWPGARLSHRTALEYAPHDGHIFLGYKYTRKLSIPGVVIHFIATPPSLSSDYPFIEGLAVSSLARAMLENLETDRTQGGVKRGLTRDAVEQRLEAEFVAGGEAALNKLRDEARAVASTIGAQFEFSRLDGIIGALLSTRPASVLVSSVARARAVGEPFDSARVELFSALLCKLVNARIPEVREGRVSDAEYKTFAFFESYFSNYIEGTQFELDEARRIIESGVPSVTRNADSHDILGTYAIASNRREMSRRPKTSDEFLEILCTRHRVMMSGRPEVGPGRFKLRDNRAGNTHFVAVDQVRGTLRQGFDMSRALNDPFAKAVFIMFVISEVHPFNDGNGRISRIMMNSELVAAGMAKIIVPTVFRPDYIGALRSLSRNRNADVLVAAMARLWDFSRWLSTGDFEFIRQRLEACNAFSDDDGVVLRFGG